MGAEIAKPPCLHCTQRLQPKARTSRNAAKLVGPFAEQALLHRMQATLVVSVVFSWVNQQLLEKTGRRGDVPTCKCIDASKAYGLQRRHRHRRNSETLKCYLASTCWTHCCKLATSCGISHRLTPQHQLAKHVWPALQHQFLTSRSASDKQQHRPGQRRTRFGMMHQSGPQEFQPNLAS